MRDSFPTFTKQIAVEDLAAIISSKGVKRR